MGVMRASVQLLYGGCLIFLRFGRGLKRADSYTVLDLGIRVWGLGFRVEGLGFRFRRLRA